MGDVREATTELLETKPALEGALREVLAVDDTTETWTFDDVPVDSGAFGELVSRGLVEKVDGAYRVADPAAVRSALSALDGEDAAGSGGPAGTAGRASRQDEGASRIGTPTVPRLPADLDVRALRSRPTVDPRTLGALGGALAFLVLMRIWTYRSVFRGEDVVLPSNDPYHYRYWVDRFVAQSDGPFDFAAVTDMPGRPAVGEPLTYVTGWWVAELLGGTPWATDQATVWLPVVCALVVGVLVYLLATTLTDDPRIGVASVIVLALLPAHALYSGIGFFDHHAFDYVWLTLTVLALTWLAVDVTRRHAAETASTEPIVAHLRAPRTWAAVAVLGVAVGLQMLYWNGAPLLLGAFALYVATRVVLDVRAGYSPVLANSPILAGLALATFVTHLPHSRWGWQEPVVVYAPALLLAGVVFVLVSAEVVRKLELHVGTILLFEFVAFVAFALALNRLRPDFIERLRARSDALFHRTDIAEVRSIFHTDFGIVFGPVEQFGLFFYLALPVLAWTTWIAYRDYRPEWLVASSFAWYLIGLTLVQIRFAGELSPVLAVFGGVAFVYVLSAVDLAERPTLFEEDRSSDRSRLSSRPDRDRQEARPTFALPNRTAATYLVVTFLVVGSLSLVMVPTVMGLVAIDDGEYEAMTAVQADAFAVGGEHTDAFVLSTWGRNRMYNYHVSGASDGYGYAARHYQPFISSGDPDAEYDGLAGTVDYVVINEVDAENPRSDVAYVRLFERYGSAGGDVDGVGHYRLLHVTERGTHAAFAVVPGATVEGTADPDATITASTDVSVPGADFTYERLVDTDANGSYAVTLAYPGEYAIGDETVTVSEEDVRTGATIAIDDRE